VCSSDLTWWNFGTAEVNSSPWNITCATVFMYNSFCDLGGISASADGPRSLFNLYQNTIHIDGFSFENIGRLPNRNWEFMFGVQQGGYYIIENINSIGNARGEVNFKALAAVTIAGSDTYLRLASIDWASDLWRDGAAALQVDQTIGGSWGKTNLQVAGLPGNIEYRNLIKPTHNQAVSAGTADPDRAQQAFLTAMHKGRSVGYEVWMDEGTGITRWDSSGMLSGQAISTLGTDAATKVWRAPYAGHVQAAHLILNHSLATANLTVTLSIDGVDCDTVLTVDSAEVAGATAVLRPSELNSSSFREGSVIKITMGGGSTTDPGTAEIDLELVQSVDETALALRWRGTHKSAWAERGPKIDFARSSTA